jgi:hypothetical protein
MAWSETKQEKIVDARRRRCYYDTHQYNAFFPLLTPETQQARRRQKNPPDEQEGKGGRWLLVRRVSFVRCAQCSYVRAGSDPLGSWLPPGGYLSGVRRVAQAPSRQ